ncbi:MAG: hypothetical protein ACQEVA_10980 [Myxococcota bacterium]
MAKSPTSSDVDKPGGGLSIKRMLVRATIFLVSLALLVIGGLYAVDAIKGSIEYYRVFQGCDRGDTGDCYDLALMYCAGDEVVEDDWKCQSLLEENCAAGHGLSCTQAGWAYLRGGTERKDDHLDGALAACEDGDMRGCHVMASTRVSDRDRRESAASRVGYAERACRGGLAASCEQWSRLLERDDAGEDERLEAARVGCDQGFRNRCLELGALLADTPGRQREGARRLESYCPAPDAQCFGLVEYRESESLSRATTMATELCLRGVRVACGWLAETLGGPGGPLDPERTAAYEAFACQDSEREDCQVDAERARTIGQTCSEENPIACMVYITHLMGDTESPWDFERYWSTLRTACAGSVSVACARLAYQARGSHEYAELRQGMGKLLCEDGYIYWCRQPRSSITAGYPLTPDPERIIRRLEARCEVGMGVACENLTGWYAHTLEIDDPPMSPELAEHYGERACELGNRRGCSTAAMARMAQVSAAFLPPDVLEQQAERHRRSCQMGLPQGCLHHGLMYASGRHRRDPGRAKQLLEDYCRGGHPWICWRLVDYYRNGRYLDKDPERADTIERALCNAGAAEACATHEDTQ